MQEFPQVDIHPTPKPKVDTPVAVATTVALTAPILAPTAIVAAGTTMMSSRAKPSPSRRAVIQLQVQVIVRG